MKSSVNAASGDGAVPVRRVFWHGFFQFGGYTEQLYFWLSIVLVGSYYLFLNYCIPLIGDDYGYSMLFDRSRRLESLMDVIESGRDFYQNWGGRIVAVAIGQLALLGEWQTAIFRVLNTFVFLGLILLLVDFARLRDKAPGSNSFDATQNSSKSEIKRPMWVLFLISFYLFWLFVRVLGEITLWLVGSVHNLWILFFILLFLRLSITLYTRKSFPILILHVLVGFLAGCGYESTSFTGLIMFLILFFRRRERFRRVSWQIPGFLTYLAGYILLVTAPGSAVRAEYTAELLGVDSRFFFMLLDNIKPYVRLHRYSWEILLILLVLVLVAFKKKVNISWTTWFFIGAGFFNNGLMLASPYLPLRSSFASSAFFICAIISLLLNPKLVTKRVLTWILATSSAVSIALAVSDGISHWESRILDKERKSIAEAALENNESTVEWPLPRTRINQRIFDDDLDIVGSSSHWINVGVADYYGFDAVFGKEPDFEHYDESELWLSANSDLGEVKLIDISKYCDERCYLYFRLSANRDLDVNWDELAFHLYYTYEKPLHKRIVGLLPDKLFRYLGTRRIAPGEIITRPHKIGEDYIFVYAIPKGHSAINGIEFVVESKPEVYRWSKREE